MATSYHARLVGGHPALDFLNSIHDWTVAERRDHLAGFGNAIGFAEAAGVITALEGAQLAGLDEGPELFRLYALRSLLERVVRAAVRGEPYPAADLARLAEAGVEVARAVRLQGPAGAPVRKEIPIDAVGAAVLRLRLVDSATALLGSTDLARVKDCPGCGWFYLDVSRNRSRRWCSMDMCGASAKARTYYRRRHPVPHPEPSAS